MYFNLNELLLNENPIDGRLYTLPNLVIKKFSETKREQRTEFPSLSLPLSLKIFWNFFYVSNGPSEAVCLPRQSGRGPRDLENFFGKNLTIILLAREKRYLKF